MLFATWLQRVNSCRSSPHNHRKADDGFRYPSHQYKTDNARVNAFEMLLLTMLGPKPLAWDRGGGLQKGNMKQRTLKEIKTWVLSLGRESRLSGTCSRRRED